MPRYEFQLVGGLEIHEEFFPASQCPELGSLLHRNGKTYRRILSGGVQLDADMKNKVHGYPYQAYSLPRFLPGCSHLPNGIPIIESQQHRREIAAANGLIID